MKARANRRHMSRTFIRANQSRVLEIEENEVPLQNPMNHYSSDGCPIERYLNDKSCFMYNTN